MSELFGNHIVGFPTRRLICLALLSKTSSDIKRSKYLDIQLQSQRLGIFHMSVLENFRIRFIVNAKIRVFFINVKVTQLQCTTVLMQMKAN